MENYLTQQEILLMPFTAFLRHQCIQKTERTTKRDFQHSFSEEIEKACLNGMIYKMIPDIIQKSKEDEKLFLLQLRCEKAFLEMEFGENYFNKLNPSFSINPNHFFSHALNN